MTPVNRTSPSLLSRDVVAAGRTGSGALSELIARRTLVRILCVLVLSVAATFTAGVADADTAPYCRTNEGPMFQFGFAELKERLGTRMGDPVECEHIDPDNGDTLQQTTRGLAYYLKATNTPVFTDGYQHWGLTTSGFLAWDGAVNPPADAVAADGPDLRPELQTLRDQRAVLVAPSTLMPFSSYPLSDVQLLTSEKPAYAVIYGELERDGAVIRGGQGQDLYDELNASPGKLCLPEDLYCQEGPLGADGQLTGERIRGLLVQAQRAVAIHETCCGVNRWSIAWYDATADASYAIVVAGAAAQPYGDALSPGNHDSARALSTLASALVPLPAD